MSKKPGKTILFYPIADPALVPPGKNFHSSGS
jgi:hypothetical protein